MLCAGSAAGAGRDGRGGEPCRPPAAGATRAELDALFTAHDFNETATAANGWLAARGAIPDVPESLCRIGTTEIAQGSDVGRLLEQV